MPCSHAARLDPKTADHRKCEEGKRGAPRTVRLCPIPHRVERAAAQALAPRARSPPPLSPAPRCLALSRSRCRALCEDLEHPRQLEADALPSRGSELGGRLGLSFSVPEVDAPLPQDQHHGFFVARTEDIRKAWAACRRSGYQKKGQRKWLCTGLFTLGAWPHLERAVQRWVAEQGDPEAHFSLSRCD